MPDQYNPPGKICPQCGTQSPYSEDFCNICGARLPPGTVCPTCGEIIPPGEMFCGSCGTPVSPPVPPPPVINQPPYTPQPAVPHYAPVIDSQQGRSAPVPGKGPRKFLVPVIIAVVVIGVLAAVVLVGIPGIMKPGLINSSTTTPGATAISRDFEGDWQVENTANADSLEIFRIAILPDNTATVSVPAWPRVKFSSTLSNDGSTLTGTYSDSASSEAGGFTFVLSDSNHFSGTWQLQGQTYTMTGKKGTLVSLPVTTPGDSTPVSRTSTTQTTAAQVSAIRAGFTTDKTSGPIPLTVSFRDTSTGSPGQWYWDFGDGTTSTEEDPVHTFKTAGSFTVVLSIDKNGQTSSKSQVISASSLPVTANFVADRSSGNAPLTVTFTDTSTGSPTTWIWQFGNGQVSYDRNPEITYQGQGTYTVQLTVEKGGVQSKKSMTINVNAAVPVSNPVPPASSTASATFAGEWSVDESDNADIFIFNRPVGNSIDGTFGGSNYTSGELKGTLSNGGRTVTGTWRNIVNGLSGTFEFTLTDANHFNGRWMLPGDQLPVKCTRSKFI